MLVLSRKNRETVVIDGCIVVKVLQIKGNTIRLGIEAPRHMSIRRGELQDGDAGKEIGTLELNVVPCLDAAEPPETGAIPITYNWAAS